MKQPQTRALFSYWNRLRQARAMPERCDIDPAAIRSVLADTFILEVDPFQTYPMRLAGARLNALFLRELKGTLFVDLWRLPGDAHEMAQLLRSVCDDSLGAVVGLTGAPAEGPEVELEMLVLPLRHYGRTHARLLGALVPTRLQSWSGLAPMRLNAMTALRVLTQRDMMAIALHIEPDQPHLLPSGRPALRLLQGGRSISAIAAQPSLQT